MAPTALVVAAVLATSLLARDAAAQSPPSAGYRIAVTTLAESVCDRAAPFVRHELPHASPFDAESDSPFAGIGSGVAVGDVDDDGDLDLAFANLAGPGSVLINVTDRRSGDGPAFVPTVIANSRTRGVFLVDENADGALDLVFTRPHTPPQLWLGDGAGDFAPADRFGAWYPAMTMAWVDADRDGDLDIASATYDAEMVEEMGNVLFGSGVVYYERDAGRLEPHSLVNTAEALALLFTDLDGDGLADILVGNDFDREDYVYLRRGSRWELAEPFAATARNTMSFAIADLDNDGSEELFAADMKPFHPDAATDAAWEPVYRFYEKPPRSSLQVNENVLLRRTTGGAPGAESPRFVNEAAARGVDASGWSWSAKFGDLDSDGFADLYVVNGMIAADLFGHLPGNELVEENLAFRNDGSGHFTAAPEWGLGDTAGGRGMSMADIDRDGDLDIVINNIDAPAVLYENRLCGGVSAQVALHWPGSANPFAVGARLRLESEQGCTDARAAQRQRLPVGGRPGGPLRPGPRPARRRTADRAVARRRAGGVRRTGRRYPDRDHPRTGRWVTPCDRRQTEPGHGHVARDGTVATGAMNRAALQRTALIYDFDGTLAPGNLQEHGFISALGMSNEGFWREANTRARVEDADQILTYLRLMLEKSTERGIPITRGALRAHGATVALFPGLSDKSWFRRMNAHAADCGLALEHYIISSGVEEMIRGCAIVDQFHDVFASKFIYNEQDQAIWPGVAINYTTKTQYLFRINRGIDNHWGQRGNEPPHGQGGAAHTVRPHHLHR